jgi:CRP-like cAMP-binding protein
MTQADHELCAHLQRLLGVLPAQASALCAAARCVRLQKGEVLLREGQRWRDLWWVAQGAFRLYFLDRDGQASNKNFFLDGAMLWPITPDLSDGAVAFWVEALEAGTVWSMPWAEWRSAMRDSQPWQALERQTLTALLQDKMQREQHFLQRSATQRYQALLEAHPAWVGRIPLRHLASYLGITDVALSRIRRRLRSD